MEHDPTPDRTDITPDDAKPGQVDATDYGAPSPFTGPGEDPEPVEDTLQERNEEARRERP